MFDNLNNLLDKPTFNVTNIKKIYDIFPRSIKTNRIVSSELLQTLEREVENQGKTIEQLQSQIERILNTELAASTTASELASSLASLGLDNLVDDLVRTFADQEKNTLISQGFIQIGSDSDVLVRVTPIESEINDRLDPFYMLHAGDDNISSADVKSPSSIEIKNVGSVPAFIKKYELWTGTIDDGNLRFILGNRAVDPINRDDINVFKFKDFPQLSEQIYKLEPDTSISTTVTTEYTSFGDYRRRAYLRKKDDTTDIIGRLYIASSRSREILEREIESRDVNIAQRGGRNLNNFTSLGTMRLRLT
jgi:hypothetical protein